MNALISPNSFNYKDNRLKTIKIKDVKAISWEETATFLDICVVFDCSHASCSKNELLFVAFYS